MNKRSKTGSPAGFTLVEMLVVIALIGTLMALLIPAVQMARERGRMTTCLNNAKNIAMAVIQYENSKRHFMGHRDVATVNDVDKPKRPVSWVFQALPWFRRDYYDSYLERPQIFEDDPNRVPQIELLICPSDPDAMTFFGDRYIRPTSYAANGGRPDSPDPPFDHKENGVFHDHWLETITPSARPTNVTLAFISKRDGAQNTILLAEKLAGAIAKMGGEKTVSEWQLKPVGRNEIEEISEGNNVLIWFRVPSDPLALQNFPPPDPSHPFASESEIRSRSELIPMRPSSNHSNGFHVAFADGRVQFMNDDIPYTLYAQLMTPYGSKSKNPGTEDLTYDPEDPSTDPYRWLATPLNEADLQ